MMYFVNYEDDNVYTDAQIEEKMKAIERVTGTRPEDDGFWPLGEFDSEYTARKTYEDQINHMRFVKIAEEDHP